MKKVFRIGSILMLVLFTMNSYSQQGTSLSIGAELGIPTGDFSESSKLGFGGSLKAAFPVATSADITLSAGYISFAGKDINFGPLGTLKVPTVNLIPLKAGFRYRFPGGFYLEPQAGYTITKVKDEDGDGAFTYAGSVGYLVNNQWDLSGRYEAATKEGSTLSYVGFRVAFILK